MREDLDYPEGATPPAANWRWFNGLDLADPQHQPARPALIEAAGVTSFDRLEDLAAVLAERLGGRRPVLKRTVASYPGFDTFPAFSIYAQAEGAQATAAQIYVGCAAVQKTRADELEAAIAGAALNVARAA